MSRYTKSAVALPAGLHLWETKPTQTGIIETRVIDVAPSNALDTSDTISFKIPGMEKYMLDKVEVVTQLRVVAANNANIAAKLNVTTAPHLAAIIWRNVDVSSNGVSLTQSFDNSYSMFKFWNTVFHQGGSSLIRDRIRHQEGCIIDSVESKAHSESLIFYLDDGRTVNYHGSLRALRIAESKVTYLRSELDISIFTQPKLLPTSLGFDVTLTKNYSETILLSAANDTSKVVFDSVYLRCVYKRPDDIILNIIEERLAKENIILHTDNRVLSFHNIPTGAAEFTIDNLFNGELPYFFLVGIQDRTAFGKTRTKNPFTLYKIKKCQLYINGQEHFARPLERSELDITPMLTSFVEQSGSINDGAYLITKNYDAYPALSFDLTADMSVNQYGLNLKHTGNARIVIEPMADQPAGRVLMVLAWYERVIEISKDRQLTIL